MDMKILLALSISLTTCFGGQPNAYSNRKEGTTGQKPNIILILADDLGWNDVGWHNSEVITPNLDRLAKNGVILENSYVQPVCTPSRAAILSGKYPHRLGLQWDVVYPSQAKWLPFNETLLPETLKANGYTTHLVGKWHLGECDKDLFPTSRGFDTFYGLVRAGEDFYTRIAFGGYDFWENKTLFYPPEGSYNTDLFTERSLEIIKNSAKSSTPFFLDLSHTTPHFPLQVPQHFADLYPGIEDIDRRTYLGMVSSLDDSVGKIVKALEEYEIMDNTIIIFLSDNGGDPNYGASNLPLRGQKGNLYEGGVKSASFVYSPSHLPRSCVHYGMIHAVDWFDTIQDMAGMRKQKTDKMSTGSFLDSVNQWPYMKKCKHSARNEMVLSIDDDVTSTAAIRVGDYKLVTGDPRVIDGVIPYHFPANPQSKAITLYDLKADPSETTNIADLNPQVVRKLLQKLDGYRKFSIPAQNPELTPTNITQPNGVIKTGWC